MSPKMSSLAEDIEYIQSDSTMDISPELYVVETRQLARKNIASSTYNLDEVVFVGGKFTISF